MKTKVMVIGFSVDAVCANRFAAAVGAGFATIARHQFPDGETRITLPPVLPQQLAIYQSLNNPNAKLVELLLAAKTARRSGVKHLTLVAPYLCYMRQDTAFLPGEAVSQTIIGEWLAQHFDAVLTVDPHLHRVHRLADAVPVKSAIALSAATAIGRFLSAQGRSIVLVGPDAESEQWVSIAAAVAGCEFGVCHKVRHTDRATTVVLPEISVAGASVVLVDDIVSSGGTLMSAARACVAMGAARVDAAVVHALYGDEVTAELTSSGITTVWSTDSVEHPTNAIPLDHLLASGFKDFVQYPQDTRAPLR
ncbi:MAG: ribose-phosphate diphosphokinase [Burkholderiales bacterium]